MDDRVSYTKYILFKNAPRPVMCVRLFMCVYVCVYNYLCCAYIISQIKLSLSVSIRIYTNISCASRPLQLLRQTIFELRDRSLYRIKRIDNIDHHIDPQQYLS